VRGNEVRHPKKGDAVRSFSGASVPSPDAAVQNLVKVNILKLKGYFLIHGVVLQSRDGSA
jgi:hypothetical protein